jgi:signal transduction histidine kinase
LQFSDNGRGFDTSKLSKEDTKGMGLSNIETRVRTVEGVFILKAHPDGNKCTHKSYGIETGNRTLVTAA